MNDNPHHSTSKVSGLLLDEWMCSSESARHASGTKADCPEQMITIADAQNIVRGSPSLTNRITAFLFITQPIAFIIAWILTLAAGLVGFDIFDMSLSEVASERASRQVIGSLVKGDDGVIRITPTRELQEEIGNASNMKYAAFDLSKEPVEGSSPELVSLLSNIVRINPAHMHFDLAGDRRRSRAGNMQEFWTDFGPINIAVHGQKFHLSDMFYLFASDAHRRMFYILVAIVLSTASGRLVVRGGLASLRKVELEAARVDLNSLDQRLSSNSVPVEISSLVRTINMALERLDAHVNQMRRFTANAAHELRTPLAIIQARLQNPSDFRLRADIERDTSHLRSIVEQMLVAARLSAGQASFEQDVDIAEVALNAVMSHMPLVVKCHRKIEFDNECGPQRIRCNRRMIESVLSNLIDNAVRAEPEGGVIFVRVKPNAMIDVIDHGEGVAERDRERIFEPFWHKSETGTGLGLAIAKEMIERQGGRIWVEETPGGGATFKLRFPTTASETPANMNREHPSQHTTAPP